MKYKCKDTLLTRSKKYDYKVYKHQVYSNMSGYDYSYYITNYNETNTIASKILYYSDVESIINKLRGI